MSWRFGECELDSETRQLLRAGDAVALTPKAFQLLELLLERHPAAVSREDIRDALWPDTVVSESNLASLVWEVRSAIGDSPRGRFLRTVRGFGYAFSGEVAVERGVNVSGPAVPLRLVGGHGEEPRVGRYPPQVGSEVAPELERAAVATFPQPRLVPPRGRHTTRSVLAGMGGVSLLVAAWALWPRETPHPTPRVRPVTSEPGVEWAPALSPDGRSVAFVKGAHLYVKLIDGGEPLLVSEGVGATFSGGPAWCPEGREIAFARRLKEDGRVVDVVFVVPALGGQPRRLATTSSVYRLGLSWSPDRSFIVMPYRASAAEPARLVRVSLEDGARSEVTRPPVGQLGDGLPRFSPDGHTIAFVRAVAPYVTDVYTVPAGGGEERRLTTGNHETFGVDWTPDGGRLVFSCWRKGGSGEISLWSVPVSGGEPELLVVGERGEWPTIARKGHRMAYLRDISIMDIWRIPGPAAGASEVTAHPMIASTELDYHARYSPDGSNIAFCSQRSGAGEIWVADRDGANPRQITFLDDPLTICPLWSPDGEQIAFTSTVEGSSDVFVVSAAGGLPQRLTSDPTRDRAESWSRDGRFIYFSSDRSGRSQIWKVPREGGEPVQVTEHGGTGAYESPNGRFLYYRKAFLGDDLPGIFTIPVYGGNEVLVLDRQDSPHWEVLEEGILHLNLREQPPVFELVDLETGEATWRAPVEVPVSAPMISMSPDRRSLLYTGATRSEADIMLVDNFEWR